jgi:hypothetical protein
LRDLDGMHRARRFARIEFDCDAERLKALRRQTEAEPVAAAEGVLAQTKKFFDDLLGFMDDLSEPAMRLILMPSEA